MTTPSTSRTRTGIVIAAVCLGGVLIAGPLVGSQVAADDLTPKAQRALEGTPISVAFTGREASLTGTGTSAEERAAAIKKVESVTGVRWATFGDSPASGSTAGADADPAPSGSTTPEPAPSETATATPAPGDNAHLGTADAATLAGLTVLFEPDSAAITPAGAAVLDQVAALLVANPDVRIGLVGHSAVATGSTAEEIAFSATRAQSAADYLVAHGIAADRLTVSGDGTSAPVGDITTPEGQAANRRVTFTETKE